MQQGYFCSWSPQYDSIRDSQWGRALPIVCHSSLPLLGFFLTPFASVVVMVMLDRDVQHPYIQSEKAARVKLRRTRMMHPIQVPWLAY